MATKDVIAPAAGVGLLALAAWGYMQYQKRQEEKPPNGLQGLKVLLDPGHEGAGLDPGAVRIIGGKQIIEADCNLGLAIATRDYLKQRGANVVMTRDRAVRLSITARKDIIRRVNPDVFVSIHHNSPPGGAENATGTLVMVNGEEDKAGTPLALSNRQLAGLIADRIGSIVAHGRSGYTSSVRTDQEASGITYGVLAACREIGKPGALLETAFITDLVWQQDRLNPSYVISLATALGDAVIASAPTVIAMAHKVWREDQYGIDQRLSPCQCH